MAAFLFGLIGPNASKCKMGLGLRQEQEAAQTRHQLMVE